MKMFFSIYFQSNDQCELTIDNTKEINPVFFQSIPQAWPKKQAISRIFTNGIWNEENGSESENKMLPHADCASLVSS